MGSSWMFILAVYYWGPVILCWILSNANVSGSSKTIANGIWFVMYAAGNIISPNIFYAREAQNTVVV